MKICNSCKLLKSKNEFGLLKKSTDGLQPRCKVCSQLVAKNHYKKHKDKVLKKTNEYNKLNKEKNKIRGDKYYKQNKEKIIERQSKRQHDNRNKINKYNQTYNKNRRLKNCLYKKLTNLRAMVNSAVRRGYTEESDIFKILGCTYLELIIYLKNTVVYNRGEYDNNIKFEIHHIIPLQTAKTEEELIKLNFYTNLEWVTKEEHIEKHRVLKLQGE